MQGVAIFGALIFVDQWVNPDFVHGGTYQECVKCGSRLWDQNGIWHGFFEYHEGRREWLWEKSGSGSGCRHEWDDEFRKVSY